MKFRETVKTLILILLIVSIMLMSIQLWIFGNLSATGEDFISSLRLALSAAGLTELAAKLGNNTPTEQYGVSDRFDLPSALTFLNGEQALSTAYDATVTIKLYSSLKPQLITLLSNDFTESSDERWAAAIENEDGILYDYGRQLSLSILLKLAKGAENEDNLRFRYIYQTKDFLLIKGSDGVYETSCTVDPYGLIKSSNIENSLALVAVIGRKSTLMPTHEKAAENLFLPPEAIYPISAGRAIPIIYYGNPVYSEQSGFNSLRMQDVLLAFGYNPGTIKKYTEKNGTEVFVENYSNIKISRDGALRFNTNKIEKGLPVAKLQGEQGDYYTVSDVLVSSQALIDRMGNALLGGIAGQLRFEQAYYSKEQEALIVEYGFAANGIRIQMQQPAFQIVYKNGYIVSVNAVFAEFEYTGTYIYPMDILKLKELYDLSGSKLPNSIELSYEFDSIEKIAKPQYIGTAPAELNTRIETE